MTSPASLPRAIADGWKKARIARPGASNSDVDAIGARWGILIPDEMRALYLLADGMLAGVSDSELLRFWPIGDIHPSSEKTYR